MKKAQSLIEYALILALVTLVAITALSLLGKKVNSAVETTGTTIEKGAKNASLQYCKSIGCKKYENGVCTDCESTSDDSSSTPEPSVE